MAQANSHSQSTPMLTRLGWILLGLLHGSLGLLGPRMGFDLAEHYSGRKLGGILDGDWFFILGLLFLAITWWLAYRCFRRAFTRDQDGEPASGT